MDWERELTVQIGKAIDARREYLGLSLRALKKRTEELGHPVSATAISDFSRPNRRPRISVADLLVLSTALEMPPMLLLFPGLPYGEVTSLPGLREPAAFAARRFSEGVEDSDALWTYIVMSSWSCLLTLKKMQDLETKIDSLDPADNLAIALAGHYSELASTLKSQESDLRELSQRAGITPVLDHFQDELDKRSKDGAD